MSEYYVTQGWTKKNNQDYLPYDQVERFKHKDELIKIKNSKIAKELIRIAKSLIAYDSKIL